MAFNTQGDNEQMMSEINVTPLVDVMLVLLVVFIVTAPLLTNAIHVNLPKTAATAPASQPQAVTVSVNATGKVFLDTRELSIPDVESELKQRKQGNADLGVHLEADSTVSYGIVAKVMAAIERAGISKLAVMTAPEFE